MNSGQTWSLVDKLDEHGQAWPRTLDKCKWTVIEAG